MNDSLTSIFGNGTGATNGNRGHNSGHNGGNVTSVGASRGLANRRTTQQDDYTPSKFWLNVGIIVDAPNDGGEIVETFIQLPKGMGLDNMEEVAIKASDTPEWAEAMRARNMLLNVIKAGAAKLDPGQSAFVDLPFRVQIRRVSEAQAETPTGESPLLTALSRAIGVAA